MEYGVFIGCDGLESLTLEEGLKDISQEAFSGCLSLTSLSLPNSILSINKGAFAGCKKIKEVSIPTNVNYIGESAFKGCSSLSKITVDKNNRYYDSRENCNAIIETSTNTLIAGCYNTTIPIGVTQIGTYAFYNCDSLNNLVMPNGITSIGKYAFQECSNLSSIVIPRSIKDIADYAFFKCKALINVTCLAMSPPDISSKVFEIHRTLHVLKGHKEDYKNHANWRSFNIIDDVELPQVSSISFEEIEYYVIIGNTNKIEPIITPSDADATLQWKSSDESVIVVDKKTGKFIGISIGEAMLTASAVDDSGISTSVKIHVVEDEESIPNRVNNSFDCFVRQRWFDMTGREIDCPDNGWGICVSEYSDGRLIIEKQYKRR